MLKNCLFGTGTLTKNAYIDKYGYSGYRIGFNRKGNFDFQLWTWSKCNNLWSRYDNKKKDILILGKGPTQGLEHTIAAEKCTRLILLWLKKKFCLSLHYNRAYSYFFANGTEIYKFKAKDFEIVVISLCLGNISKDWSLDYMKKTRFNGYVYDFSVDYNATNVNDILDTHKYLIKKNNIV